MQEDQVKILIDITKRMGPEGVAVALDKLSKFTVKKYGVEIFGPKAPDPRDQKARSKLIVAAIAKRTNRTVDQVLADPNKAAIIVREARFVYKDIRRQMEREMGLTAEQSLVLMPDPKDLGVVGNATV